MRRSSPLALALAALLVGGLAGCATTVVRDPAASPPPHPAPANLDPATAARLQQRHEIAVGDTPDMVELALGRPLSESHSADGTTTWFYRGWPANPNDYIQDGFRHRTAFNPVTRMTSTTIEPVKAGLYPSLEVPTTTVTFRDGHATAVQHVP